MRLRDLARILTPYGYAAAFVVVCLIALIPFYIHP